MGKRSVRGLGGNVIELVYVEPRDNLGIRAFGRSAISDDTAPINVTKHGSRR